MPIQVLSPDVAAKIAAGEVVERPANVAKELIENSLDAGATEIRVEIREGGLRLLRITDNGHGIPAVEAPLAFARHATSKLSTAADLDHIATFGFRGEALYSIAAVSQVTVTTRHAAEEYGTQVRVDGGAMAAPGRAGAPTGTVVNVENLFFNVPARRKFLRKPATEAGQIAAVVQRYALAHPERRFSLVSDGRLVFQSTGSGDLLDVLVKVYTLEIARQMTPVGAPPAARPGEAPAALLGAPADEVDFMDHRPPRAPAAPGDGHPAIAVHGYASLPSLTRANRSNIDLFVNRRYVEDRSLAHAVVQAYHTLLPVGRYPLAVILVTIDPSRVDVNVHPQKTQVRFVDEREVFHAVQQAVRRALIQHAPVPQVAVAAEGGDRVPAPPGDEGRVAGWSQRRESILQAGRQPVLDIYVPPAGQRSPLPVGQPVSPAAVDPLAPATGVVDSPSRPAVLRGRSPDLPPLRVVGQVGAMYIVAEGPEGLYLIDQHAAHERILYEEFMARRYGGIGSAAGSAAFSQQLLEPLTLHVGGELAGAVAHHLDALGQAGFVVEPFGGDTFLVRAVPAVLAGQEPLAALEEIVQALGDRRNRVDEEVEARLVKLICKRAAIKAGQLLSDIEMQELVRQLEACQSPRTCPHGRPTMIQLSAGELEKAFGRV